MNGCVGRPYLSDRRASANRASTSAACVEITQAASAYSLKHRVRKPMVGFI